MELVLEPAERSPPLEGFGQASSGGTVADALSEVGHVLMPDVRGDRVDGNEVQLIDLNGVLAVDAVSLVQNATWPVRGSSSPRCS